MVVRFSSFQMYGGGQAFMNDFVGLIGVHFISCYELEGLFQIGMFRFAEATRFPAGREPEPLRLRLQGLNLPYIPAGVGHPPLIFTLVGMDTSFL